MPAHAVLKPHGDPLRHWPSPSSSNTPERPRPLPTPRCRRASQATNLFSSWPDVILQRLRRNLVPVALRRGEFAVLAGDPGVVMYIIDHGCVEVLIQNPATDGKRRAPGIKVCDEGG